MKVAEDGAFSGAETRLAAVLDERRQNADRPVDTSSAEMTFGEAAALHMGKEAKIIEIKRRIKTYRVEVQAALLRSWPKPDELLCGASPPSLVMTGNQLSGSG